jgi:alkanesulfonate monooxygenase SsuD/methylene tetrahydromethanopterin reductase-like flavin-dependent oxidoreductase (luciferase family)
MKGRKETIMKIGVGLPATIPGASPALILDWARKTDAGPFSSLGIVDRLVYTNYEPLITLAAAAAVTHRIGLMTTILLAPLRNTGILAKQAASLDALSGGRLTLGLAVGRREGDYRAAPASFHDRGRRFDEQLQLMKRIWSGQPRADDIGPVGPAPARKGGPEVLIGGYSPAAIRRLARWGDGYISGGGAGPARVAELYRSVEEAWKTEGRSGRPRLVGAFYWGLGPNAAERSAPFLRSYYGFLGPVAENMIKALPTTVEAIRDVIAGYAAIGMDELIAWPCIADLDQVERLADLVG